MTSLQTVMAPDVLSDREREVVELVADGLTNAEIADHLYICKRTVESHVENAKRKLGLVTRNR
jgi:DNA-binding NarL/FixJ family response regulator